MAKFCAWGGRDRGMGDTIVLISSFPKRIVFQTASFSAATAELQNLEAACWGLTAGFCLLGPCKLWEPCGYTVSRLPVLFPGAGGGSEGNACVRLCGPALLRPCSVEAEQAGSAQPSIAPAGELRHIFLLPPRHLLLSPKMGGERGRKR